MANHTKKQNLFRRCVDYAAKVYDLGSRAGDGENYAIPPVYFIGILGRGSLGDRSGQEWTERYISEYTFHSVLFLLNRTKQKDASECMKPEGGKF